MFNKIYDPLLTDIGAIIMLYWYNGNDVLIGVLLAVYVTVT